MGTRNLTLVYSDNETKVAQYGQWDGYPTGQGQTIADFLKTVDLPKFKKQVDSLGTYTEDEMKQALKDAGWNGEDEFINMSISDKRDQAHPALNRDHGAGILELIHNGKVTKVKLAEDFKNDSIWCEYYYEIDLDKKTVSMNGGKKYTFEEWTKDNFMEKLEDE